MSNSTNLKNLGLIIKKYRIKISISQEELGFRCNIHRTTIGKIENGEMDPKYTTLIKIVRTLNIPSQEIF